MPRHEVHYELPGAEKCDLIKLIWGGMNRKNLKIRLDAGFLGVRFSDPRG
jgi:hypothetical protein